MSGFLLDTSCISELVRPKPDLGVLDWMDAADEAVLHLSVLTLGEIRKGVERLPQGRRRTRLETWLMVDLHSRFAGRILSIGESIAERWGVLATQAKRDGWALGVMDGLLAATALEDNLTIVSRNAKDFERTGAALVNPWAN